MRKRPYFYISFALLLLVGVAAYFVLSRSGLDSSTWLRVMVSLSNHEDLENLPVPNDGYVRAGPDLDGAAVVAVVPNLDRQIIVPASIPAQIKENTVKEIERLKALLKQDSNLFNEWLDLGMLYKSFDDYEGAREAWEYASVIRPVNSLSFGNLGVLYGYYLKNPVLAEKNYLKAIENDPKLPYLYGQTADFYLEVALNPVKARSILEKGLKAIPGDEGLLAALASIE